MQNGHSKYYFRFFLEVAALVAIGWYGSTFSNGWLSIFNSFGLVFGFMLIWGVFNVPGDPSRSGKAPVVVSGKIRLALETILFLFATFAFYQFNQWFALVYLLSLVAHYIHTKERVNWIWKK